MTKVVEFKTKLKNKTIKIPKRLSSILSENENIRVILMFDDKKKQGDDFKTLTKKQFLFGYSDSDSIYDNY